MKEFISVMKALRDSRRVKIVKMLQHGELCVCEIQVTLGVSQSTASKHLKILEEAGLLKSRKEGLWVYYLLDDGGRNPYAAVLLGNLRFWLEEDRDMAELVKKIPDIRRKNLCGVQ